MNEIGPASKLTQARLVRWLDVPILIGVLCYVAGRFSEETALVNVGFYLPLVGLGVHGLVTRGRDLVGLARSRVALSLAAFGLTLIYAVLIAPAPAAAAAAFAKAHGHAFVIAAAVAYVAAREANARLLLLALVAGAADVVLRQLWAHWSLWTATGTWIAEYPLLRHHGDGHAFYLPACVAMLLVVPWPSRAKLALGGLVLVQTGLLLLTGYRGAWSAAAAAFLFAALASRSWKTLVIGLMVPVAVTGAMAVAFPDNPIVERLHQGFDTSMRTSGTWWPTITLIAERPLSGYGYSTEVFHRVFNSKADQHPEWPFHTSLGPHNNYLEIWFAGGILALLALLWLYGEMLTAYLHAFKTAASLEQRALALSAGSSFISAYLVHGLFENKLWPALGIVLGLALGLAARRSGVTDNPP